MDTRDPRNPLPPPEPPPKKEEKESEGNAVLKETSAQISKVRQYLTVQEEDSLLVGGLKMLGMAAVAIFLLAISPLILLGLIVGLAAAA
ncbi:MAG: hypothetical protein AB8F78_08695 [Saprospiraceae bacterium]